MNRKRNTPVLDHSERLPRVAWLFAFALPLALAMLLLGVKSSQAATPQAPMPGSPAFAAGFEEFEEAEEDEEAEEEEAGLEEELELEDVEEFEDEDEGLSEVEFAREECEMAEEEAAEGEISGAEAKEVCAEAEREAREARGGHGREGKDECPIHSATAHASVHNHRVRLTVGYTTAAPVTATVQLRGPVKGSFKRHLGASGVVHFTKRLPKKAHGNPVVRIKLPASERGSCRSRRLVLLAR